MPFHKARSLAEVDQAVRFNDAIGPEHAFYTEFSDLRGDFEELLAKNLVMEYNTGNYKRLNPILELSDLYQQKIIT